jgi:lipoate-protein ligase A
VRVPVEHASGADNLRRDEEMLAAGALAGRVAVLTDGCWSVGVSHSLDGPVARRAAAMDLVVLRRSTGGSGVLTAPGDLAWSMVLPGADPRVGRDFVRAFSRLGEPIVAGLAEFGWSTAWTAGPSPFPELCLLSGRGSVLRHGPRVLGGAAQHRTGLALLHHGILLRTVDRVRVGILLERDAAEFGDLAGWQDLPPGPEGEVAPEAMAERLATELGRWLGTPYARSVPQR